jgi:hypothetical protein
MDLDRDTQLGREERASPGKRLGAMSYSCMGSSHCMRLPRIFIFGGCEAYHRLSSQGSEEYHIICLRPAQNIYQNILHVN